MMCGMVEGVLDIDGTFGEGGGQILRTALALACAAGRAFRITNIRAKRSNPGLARQHLACVEAARNICAARVSGALLRSAELEFHPGPVRAGDYRFDVGTAGSATLVAQTVLPALFVADAPSRVTIDGGTHNPWAPPFDFLAEVFLPAIALMGFRAEASLERHGFYPAGGGRISLAVEPAGAPAALDLTASPGEIEWTGRIYDSMLPPQVAESERSLMRRAIPAMGRIEHRRVVDSPGPGNCVMAVATWAASPQENSCAGTNATPATAPGTTIPPAPTRRLEKTILTAFGQKGKPARAVVEELREQCERFAAAGAPVDEHLADQLLIYMALVTSRARSAGSAAPEPGAKAPYPCQAGAAEPAIPCRFATGPLNLHATTNMAVIEKFLPVGFAVEATAAGHVVSCVAA